MPSTDKAVIVDGIRKTFGSVVAVRDISFDVEARRGARPCWARTAQARRRRWTFCRRSRGRITAMRWSPATTSSRDPAGVRRSIMLTGQHVALDDMLTGRENLVMFGRLQGLKKSAARLAGEGASRPVRPGSMRPTGASARIPVGCAGGSTSPADWWSVPKWCFWTNPRPGWIRAAGRASGIWCPTSRTAGIATLLTTQYLEEADALSDRIIVIDHGTIIAEGTADELKERTGATYCEIVPRHLKDLPAVAEALGPLLPEKYRAALTTASDRDRDARPRRRRTLLCRPCID